jgi:hypothetical protein
LVTVFPPLGIIRRPGGDNSRPPAAFNVSDEQDASGANSDRNRAVLLVRLGSVFEFQRERVVEHPARCLEGDAMLPGIGGGFGAAPFEAIILIIVAYHKYTA